MKCTKAQKRVILKMEAGWTLAKNHFPTVAYTWALYLGKGSDRKWERINSRTVEKLLELKLIEVAPSFDRWSYTTPYRLTSLAIGLGE